MNGRILELVKNPDLFQIQDLELLSSEINKHPYIQSLRALHLLGTHRLQPENYARQLSLTAAYTTDKKILYQLINSVEEKQPVTDLKAEPVVELPEVPTEEKNKFNEIESVVVETPKPVYVNGVLNRILFEGEEDFLERELDPIDVLSTLESGELVLQQANPISISNGASKEHETNEEVDPELEPEFRETKDAETFSTEKIVHEEEITEEKPVIQDKTEKSFHEIPEFPAEDKTTEEVDTELESEILETKNAETFSTEKIVREEEITEEKPVIHDKTEKSFHEIPEFPAEDKTNEEVDPELESEFTEIKDAETFSKEKIVHEEEITEEKPVIKDKTEKSFHEIPEFPAADKTTEEVDPELESEFTETKDAETFSREKIIDEDRITEEKPVIKNEHEISFHGLEDFLPEVKIAPNPHKELITDKPKQTLNKHEEEMKRLIAEVEAKMKSSKKEKNKKIENVEKEELTQNSDVNFSETQSFDLSKSEESEKQSEDKEAKTQEIIQNKEESVAEQKPVEQTESLSKPVDSKPKIIQETKPTWKPMSFSANTPDALISKKADKAEPDNQIQENKATIKSEQKEEVKEDKTQSEDRPVYNVSFFTQNVSTLPKEKEEQEIPPILKEDELPDLTEESNVPTFINTWQNWLKIDRNQEQAKEKLEISITEIKNKVIENFIEKEPRISKLKDESDFVIKERNDDISHLMTQTLANIYTEQKLYAKAIKAYGTLSEKHPERKSLFDDKIKEIKELRQNK